MFALFRSRDKMVRFLLGAFLVVVSLSMLTYLIPSYNTGGSASDTVVAQIGKETLTLPEVQQTIQNALRGRQMPAEMIPHYVPQIVEELITERALAYEATRLGLKVSDNDLAQGIRASIPSLFPDGKFVGKDAYANFLAQQNFSIPEFEANMARQLLVTKLRQVVLEGTIVSPQEIEREYHRTYDKVKVEWVKIPTDQYRSEVKVTPEDMKAFYDQNRAMFQIPEKRSLGILILNQAKLEQSINPTDAELQRAYNQNKDRFRTPERVKVRHILLTTTGKSKDEEVAIRAKAESLLKQVKGGADFAKLAKENSQDPGSAPNGGELGWVVRGQTVPEFEKTAFSLKPGEISDLVKTQYGYHIIQLEQKEPARLKPFAEVKAELAADYKKQRVGQEMQGIADKAQAALKKDPLHPDKVAAELNMQFVKADNVQPGDPLPEVGVSKDFEDSLAGLKAGDASQPVLLPGNRLVLASITGVTPAHPASFDEAQNQIRDTLTKDRLSKLQAQKADELVAKAKALNGDLKKAAQSMGLEVKSSGDVTRAGAIEGLGSASYLADAFSKPAGTIIGPVSMLDAKVVAKIVEHQNADSVGLAAQRESLRDQLKSQKAQERDKLFEDGVLQALIREGKVKIHQPVIDRLTANYRG